MTDSMNFGPDWIRNLSSEGTTTGNNSGGKNYQLADYRYGREEMLALFDKTLKPPESLMSFKTLYSETTLFPLALGPSTEEEQRGWQSRPSSLAGPIRGRGGPMDRGGRVSRGGRGGYQNYGRPATTYDGGWGTSGETTEWSPRKEFNTRGNDNWRRNRLNEDDDGWRNLNHGRPAHDKWGRSSWRGGDGEPEERIERHGGGPDGRPNRMGWNEGTRTNHMRRSWDEDHLPEWAMENVDGGGTFDSTGAFHNSDEEQKIQRYDRRSILQGEGKSVARKETVLQKSSSQQHITPNKGYFSALQTSKSVASLSKTQQDNNCVAKDKNSERDKETATEVKKVSEPNKQPQLQKNKSEEEQEHRKEKMREASSKQKVSGTSENSRETNSAPIPSSMTNKDSRVEDDFKIQEDSIIKLVDDDSPKSQTMKTTEQGNSSNIQPPPNLAPPLQDQWYYEDPQGLMQGPFSSAEMAEWYKAGYFNSQLKVRRPCDELFYMLGELVVLCDGANPFLGTKRFVHLKPDPTAMPEHDLLQYQYLMALRQAQTRPVLPEPWSTLTLQQQQEVAAQRLIMHPQVPQEIPYIHHQPNPPNPLMHIINQMQQANKLPNQTLADKAQTAIPNQLDPRLVQLSNLHQLQNRLPPSSAIPNPLASRLPGLSADGLNLPGVLGAHPLGLTPGMGPNLGNSLNLQRQMSHNTVVENLVPKPPEDAIGNLLKHLHQQKQQQQQAASVSLDTLWQSSQYAVPQSLPTPQWQQEPSLSMWDINKLPEIPTTQHQQPQQQPPVNMQETIPPTKNVEKEKSQQKAQDKRDEMTPKELKKKKEQEEKQAKKEAEEKRKNEQRKLEAEKRAAEEKKKKEEEKIKKEMEKAKKEAEEKRLRELEEKRKLKEQRKAEEEAKKKTEEQKKADEERAKKEAREREEYAKKEAARLAQEQAIRNAKIAPWCQSSSSQGLSLQEIQKLEKEKARQEALILQQQRQMQELQQQQEKAAASFTWAAKAKEQRQVKSLAEIQAEEQERLAKQAAEAKLLAMQKEKEQPPVHNTGNIWHTQNLSWSTNVSSTWSYNNNNTSNSGLWEEVSGKPAPNTNKPSNNSKGSASTTKPQQQTNQQQSQKAKSKSKKEESNQSKNGATNSVDEFTNWCTKALSNITAEIDIPTFVTFLKDIESAMDVRDYCKEYLGDNPQTLQFAAHFLEKRRSFRPKNQAPKDDMCSPASAINPSSVHSNEFQEVKGKNKKNKKNKMLKVDSRILGFNVTSAPDRINVGDRDYGDNS
ncbi:GIGYF family protein Gyf isoform X2 [Harmonia axyridis]|nr:GIGYF family protein Gyf isoform X2 [Harmonia axyridis]XP_045478723.1 GIGYF family protein Gyf isoform X2 [Harmonia axyridis]